MTAGRPTDYDANNVAEEIKAYIAECKTNYYLPTIEGLAVHLCVARSTIYLWAKEHPEFSDILEQLLALQGSMLIQNGLKGEYNPTITKLMLTKHDYSDKQDVDHTTKGQPIAPIVGMRIIDDSKGGTA